MDLRRLRYYLSGGTPPGGARTCPGCRDPRPPERSVPVLLPGGLYFATESALWGGGRAFYDPAEPGVAPARAHLLTAAQFSDIAAQEMYRTPGADLDLTEVLTRGRARLGPGRYETLVCPGLLDGLPVVTFTAPWGRADVPGNAPSAPYLRHLAAGLMQAHGWSAARAAGYLAGCSGAREAWTPKAVLALLESADGPPDAPPHPSGYSAGSTPV
ncbi:histone deacetylase [Streptomyces sp. PR69]|uniref:histone deacetylase n=1 Tax=Streptomyces sp. PR69 TaxID=2984950 RepID=UPI0022646E71|nr:histone deacetylase [Streptomyces sp. PR69]